MNSRPSLAVLVDEDAVAGGHPRSAVQSRVGPSLAPALGGTWLPQARGVVVHAFVVHAAKQSEFMRGDLDPR